jgi:hypothetical protein
MEKSHFPKRDKNLLHGLPTDKLLVVAHLLVLFHKLRPKKKGGQFCSTITFDDHPGFKLLTDVCTKVGLK